MRSYPGRFALVPLVVESVPEYWQDYLKRRSALSAFKRFKQTRSLKVEYQHLMCSTHQPLCACGVEWSTAKRGSALSAFKLFNDTIPSCVEYQYFSLYFTHPDVRLVSMVLATRHARCCWRGKLPLKYSNQRCIVHRWYHILSTYVTYHLGVVCTELHTAASCYCLCGGLGVRAAWAFEVCKPIFAIQAIPWHHEGPSYVMYTMCTWCLLQCVLHVDNIQHALCVKVSPHGCNTSCTIASRALNQTSSKLTDKIVMHVQCSLRWAVAGYNWCSKILHEAMASCLCWLSCPSLLAMARSWHDRAWSHHLPDKQSSGVLKATTAQS